MKTTWPAKAGRAAAGQLHFDRHRPAGDFLGADLVGAQKALDPQPVDANDLHDGFAGGDPLALFVKERDDDAVQRRNDLPPGDRVVGRLDRRLMHVGVHLGDAHLELAPLDLQLVAMLGELQLLDFLLRHAAGAFALDGQRPFQLGSGHGKGRLGVPHLDVVLGLGQRRVALQLGRQLVQLRLPVVDAAPAAAPA